MALSYINRVYGTYFIETNIFHFTSEVGIYREKVKKHTLTRKKVRFKKKERKHAEKSKKPRS